MVISDWREARPEQVSPFGKLKRLLAGSGRQKRNLVRIVLLLFMIPSMNQKHRFCLFVLVLATLALSSCMNQEGVGPAEGEAHAPTNGASFSGY
jgi:hypothetical protein